MKTELNSYKQKTKVQITLLNATAMWQINCLYEHGHRKSNSFPRDL